MRSRLHFVQHRARLAVAERGADILLTWTETTGATPDAVTGAKVGGTTVTRTETVKGLIHAVSPAKSGVQQFNEIELGDLIVDFNGDVVLDGRNLVFTIDGQGWVAKQIGDRLGRTWDASTAGVKFFRTALLRKQT